MGTILLIIVGIVVGIAILSMVVSGIKEFLSKAFSIVGRFPALFVLLIAGLFYFDRMWIPVVIYCVLYALKTKEVAEKEIENQALNRIGTMGLISKQEALGLLPGFSPLPWLTDAMYEKEHGSKVLDKEIEKGNLVLRNYNGTEFYCNEARWKDVQAEILNKTINTISEHINSWGFIAEDIRFNVIKEQYGYDTAVLVNILTKKIFTQYMGKMLSEGRVFVEETEKERRTIKLYINKDVLSAKQQYIRGCDIIEKDDLAKIFGTNDVGEQKGIMNAITSHIWTGTSYVFLDGIDDKRNYIWLNEATIKDHTCAKCKKIVRKPTQYGKEQYCASCLQEIHAQEDADEAEGKAVKRYISAPPPGVKIKM